MNLMDIFTKYFLKLEGNKKFVVIVIFCGLLLLFVSPYLIEEEETKIKTPDTPEIVKERNEIVSSLSKPFAKQDVLIQGDSLKYKAQFTQPEIDYINRDSYVFSYDTYETGSVLARLNVKELLFDYPTLLRFRVNGTIPDFINNYEALLNDSLGELRENPGLVFTVRKRAFTTVEQDDPSGELGTEDTPFLREDQVYGIYLNGAMLTHVDAVSEIYIQKPLGQSFTDFVVTIPRFIPSRVSIHSKYDFSVGDYTVVPSIPVDSKFYKQMVDLGFYFNPEDFEIAPGTGSKVYIFDVKSKRMAPHLVKSATVRRIPNLQNYTFIMAVE